MAQWWSTFSGYLDRVENTTNPANYLLKCGVFVAWTTAACSIREGHIYLGALLEPVVVWTVLWLSIGLLFPVRLARCFFFTLWTIGFVAAVLFGRSG